MRETVASKGPGRQRVAPIVAIAGHEHWQVGALTKQRMGEQVINLPVALFFGQAQVPMHEVQRPFGRFDDDELRAARLLRRRAGARFDGRSETASVR